MKRLKLKGFVKNTNPLILYKNIYKVKGLMMYKTYKNTIKIHTIIILK